ncbi:MAG: fibronectin type III domain-containing protein [Bacteroidetes bacterium]|nr:fibronectin type III domain-containing protein [Bacteroidota bacterium]
MMTGNLSFPAPSPTLPNVKTATDALLVAYNEAKDLGKTKTYIMRQRRAALLALISRLAAYVQDVSDGVGTVILSSGFGVTAEPRPLAPVGMVLHLRLRGGKFPGSIHAIWDKVIGAGAYAVEISDEGPSPDSFYLHKIVLSSRCDIIHLEPGRMYWVRVYAVGRLGYGEVSGVCVAHATL